MLTLSFIFCIALYSKASTSSIEKSIDQTLKFKNGKEPQGIKSECTVTASWTASGEDCFGNPITVTGTCTSTASNCTQAYNQAGACAFTVATLGLSQINDCP